MTGWLLRIVLAVGFIAATVVVLAPYAVSDVSKSAIVNAPLITIKAPFDGIISDASPGRSTAVAEGDRSPILGLHLGGVGIAKACQRPDIAHERHGRDLMLCKKDTHDDHRCRSQFCARHADSIRPARTLLEIFYQDLVRHPLDGRS
jgi:hypothetical protein